MNIDQIPKLTVMFGFVLLLAELFLGLESGFDLVVIGSILIISGLIGSTTGNLPLMLIVAIILAAIYFFIGRKYLRKKITNPQTATNTNKLIGKKAIVTKAITPEQVGRVKTDDEEWRATSKNPHKVGAKVSIKSFEGVTVEV